MMSTRTAGCTARAVSIFAAAAIALSTVASAQAANDPTAEPAAKQELKPLSGKARKMVWCVTPKNAAPDAKKECKTREKWIKEGRDPFGKY